MDSWRILKVVKAGIVPEWLVRYFAIIFEKIFESEVKILFLIRSNYSQCSSVRNMLEKQGRTHKWCTLMDPHTWPCKMQDDQHEHTFSNYVRIQDVVQKTCLRRWTIGKSGERGSGISVLPARHDDDDDDDDFSVMKTRLGLFYANWLGKTYIIYSYLDFNEVAS